MSYAVTVVALLVAMVALVVIGGLLEGGTTRIRRKVPVHRNVPVRHASGSAQSRRSVPVPQVVEPEPAHVARMVEPEPAHVARVVEPEPAHVARVVAERRSIGTRGAATRRTPVRSTADPDVVVSEPAGAPVEHVIVPAMTPLARGDDEVLMATRLGADPGASRTGVSEAGDSNSGLSETSEPSPPAPGPVSSINRFVVRIDSPDAGVLALGDPGVEREMAGILFAAYVSERREEWSRVTGWITAVDRPPSLSSLRRGVGLRGRAPRIDELLGCSDENRNWVTLQTGVDIARGLKSRAPVDEILKGVLWWWYACIDEQARIPADHIAVFRSALETLFGALARNPSAPLIDALLELVREAEAEGVGITVSSVSIRDLGPDVRQPGERRDGSIDPHDDFATTA